MNRNFAKITENGAALAFAPNAVRVEGRYVVSPSAASYAAAGYYPVTDAAPAEAAPAGKHYEPRGWEYAPSAAAPEAIRRVYQLVDDPPPPPRRMLLGARMAMMAGKPLPYDAEVEYLEGTGTQWIDTGITYSTSSSYLVETRARFRSRPSADTYVGWDAGGAFGWIARSGVNKWGNGSSDSSAVIAAPYDVTADMTLDIRAGAGTLSYFTIAGYGTISRAHASLAAYALSNGYPLFARASQGVMAGRAIIYEYARIYRDDILVCDLIPVRVGSGTGAVGYMYDRVSGQLFGNSGTGAFTIGPDKAT